MVGSQCVEKLPLHLKLREQPFIYVAAAVGYNGRKQPGLGMA
jgi:hypothetical protein